MDAMHDRHRIETLEEECIGYPPIDLLIVDEAHHLIGRSGDTFRRRFVEALSILSSRAVGLTATPMQIELNDLMRVLQVIDPGQWEDEEHFEQVMELQATLNNLDRMLSGEQGLTSEEAKLTLKRANQIAEELKLDGTLRSLAQLKLAKSTKKFRAPEDRHRIRKLIRDAAPLSGRLTRTRRVDVGEYRNRKATTLRIKLSASTMKARQHDKMVTVSEQSIFTEIDALLKESFFHVHRRQLSSCLPAMAGLLHSGIEGFKVWTDGDSVVPEEIYDTLDVDERTKFAPVPIRLDEHAIQKCRELASKHNLLQTDTKFSILIDEVRRLRDCAQAKKVIVFTEWRPTIKYLKNKAREIDDMKWFAVTGEDSEQTIESTLSQFQSYEGFAILFSADVLSEGVDIQSADCVVNYDLPYNPQRIEQRIGRIDRIGQDSDKITIINLVVEDSTDEKVFDILLSRIGVFEKYITDLLPILVTEGEQQLNIDSTQAESYISKLDDIERLQKSECLLGLDDILDDDILEAYQRRRKELSELRLLPVRDFFVMALGKNVRIKLSKDMNLLEIQGLTEADAEMLARLLPIDISDSVRKKIDFLVKRDGELAFSTDKNVGNWYLPVMHPLVELSCGISHYHHYRHSDDIPVELIVTDKSLKQLPGRESFLVVTEHVFESQFGGDNKWNWWIVDNELSRASRVDGIDVEALVMAVPESDSSRISQRDTRARLSQHVLDDIAKEHDSWLKNVFARQKSQALAESDQRIKRMAYLKSRLLEDEEGSHSEIALIENVLSRLQRQVNSMENSSSDSSGSFWRIVTLISSGSFDAS
jgi:superfamily II DNA or RNA helicase